MEVSRRNYAAPRGVSEAAVRKAVATGRVPSPALGGSTKGSRIMPAKCERRTGLRLQFVYRRRDPCLLVAERQVNSKGRAFGGLTRPHRATIPPHLPGS